MVGLSCRFSLTDFKTTNDCRLDIFIRVENSFRVFIVDFSNEYQHRSFMRKSFTQQRL